jgi:hypothetical protein
LLPNCSFIPHTLGAGSLFSEGMASPLLACGAALLVFLTIVRMRKRYAANTGQPSTGKERLDAIRRKAAARDGVGSAMAEVEELTRRCAAHLDNKAARLEYLLELAEARIAELEERTGEGATGPNAAVTRPAASAETAGPGEAASYPFTPDAGPTGSAATDEPQGVADRLPPPVIPETVADPLTRQIYELADGGSTPVEIARKLDEQVGKVELILALRAG